MNKTQPVLEKTLRALRPWAKNPKMSIPAGEMAQACTDAMELLVAQQAKIHELEAQVLWLQLNNDACRDDSHEIRSEVQWGILPAFIAKTLLAEFSLEMNAGGHLATEAEITSYLDKEVKSWRAFRAPLVELKAKCKGCGSGDAAALHPCPYAAEINGVEHKCNCCPCCESQCEKDI